MKVSVITTPSYANISKTELGFKNIISVFEKNNGKDKYSRKQNNVSFENQLTMQKTTKLKITAKSSLSEPITKSKSSTKSKSLNSVRLFAGLSEDVVSGGTVNHFGAISAGLKALKLLGLEGVELPIWWGVVENEEMGKYEWSGYLTIAEMVRKAGLKLHVTLCFHGSSRPKIPLPKWVTDIGKTKSNIFYKDKAGKPYRGCLSLGVDDLVVLNGKTPMEVYQDFCESFKSAFSSLIGSTITGITMGLGPDGELRYPSHRKSSESGGAGEFQCYDKNMLNLLKKHAEAFRKPLWGNGGPHDAPSYDESPKENTFFKDDGGSWESPYSEFFLSWYANQLVSHGDRMLSLASSIFSDSAVNVYGKLPLMYSLHKARSHPSELTAGFYNTALRNGYEGVAEMFARNSCKIILPGMDLSDKHQPQESLSSPELLLSEIRTVCKKHGVGFSGHNLDIRAPDGFKQIKKNMSGGNLIDSFTFVRMGTQLFAPDHFPTFIEFVLTLNQHELQTDDMLTKEATIAECVHTSSDQSIHMQIA